MPDANAHAESMTIIRPSSMPRLWWLNPWATARYLHAALTAMKGYADRADKALDIQARIIAEQSDEIRYLRQRVADLNDAIVAGHAIVPDRSEEHTSELQSH